MGRQTCSGRGEGYCAVTISPSCEHQRLWETSGHAEGKGLNSEGALIAAPSACKTAPKDPSSQEAGPQPPQCAWGSPESKVKRGWKIWQSPPARPPQSRKAGWESVCGVWPPRWGHSPLTGTPGSAQALREGPPGLIRLGEGQDSGCRATVSTSPRESGLSWRLRPKKAESMGCCDRGLDCCS